MQVSKRLVCPQRMRQVRRPFGWVDSRLIREERLKGCGPEAWALYLFWVVVCDGRGLSYYSDPSMSRLLGLPVQTVASARQELIQAGLVAYEAPLVQVLSLDRPHAARAGHPAQGSDAGVVLGDVLRALVGGAS